MKRRDLLGMMLASGLAYPMRQAMAQEQATLRQAAEAKGLLYGCAVDSRKIARDRPFADLVAREAGILVHEGEMKRHEIEPRADVYNFEPANRIMRFAETNHQLVRGHTLVWFNVQPQWLEQALETPDMTARTELLTGYINKVVGYYKGRIHSWDVVNEAVEPADWRWDRMRSSSIWYKAFGEDYISMAFHAAKEADPKPILFLNDYGIESDVRWNETRRSAVLKLLDRLKAKNVPVEGFGIQGHLKPYKDKFGEETFARFLHDLEGYGLKLMITELDIADSGGPADDPAQRDQFVASVAKSFLDVALASPSMLGVLTWGITDRYSWLSSADNYKWPDGQLVRGLPFDSDLKPKPMFDAMMAAFKNAPAR
ncbi:hypothetical protein BJF93_03520 [Xaviernesmea oryzae]|uniref:Beta-xylanase n=1 Tax=Xaviernesmea oryzae TaxID=464029 RepID=A0A1Q9AU84_9HYPH|nr:endo-1,4-beta-xylanase [Xaviernesmea oryzae]OLP59010.1 hypothetical protein BJF93_03520 [Xaviernesmea oryzae]SEK90711.1 endo-1,4-beta-xylanase [Xaviernesmea oryzae]